MGSLNGRVRRLEERMPPPEDAGAKVRLAVMYAILDEIGRLRGCRANRGYRGGTPPTPIQPTDPAGDALGYPYTYGELVEFAIWRVVEREFADLDPDEHEDLIEKGADLMRDLYERASLGCAARWDEVAAEGPPEPTPPWTFGGFSR